MIIINKTKKTKEYQMPEIPNYQSRRFKVKWLRRQRMEAMLTNIKSIDIQVKDIKQMIYTNHPRLVYLYATLNIQNKYYNDEDYITISKYRKNNKSLIYAIITSDWIIKLDEINNKEIEELQEDLIELENTIINLEKLKEGRKQSNNIDYKIKLYQYKLKCLNEYLLNQSNILSRKLTKQ